jgi:hypothetical protein
MTDSVLFLPCPEIHSTMPSLLTSIGPFRSGLSEKNGFYASLINEANGLCPAIRGHQEVPLLIDIVLAKSVLGARETVGSHYDVVLVCTLNLS